MNTLIISLVIFLLGLYFVVSYPTYEAFTSKKGSTGYRCANILFQRGTDFFLYNSNLANIPGVNPLQFKNLEEYVEFTEWQRRQGIKCPILYVQEAYDAQGNTVYKARPSPTDMHGGLPDLIINDGHSNQNIMPMPNNTANSVMPMPNSTGNPIMPNPQVPGMAIGYPNASMPMIGASDRNKKDTFDPRMLASMNPDIMPPRNDESLLLDAGQDDRPYNINSYPGFDGNNQYIGLDTPLDKMFHENKGGVSPNQMDPNWGGAKYTEDLVRSGYYKDNEVNLYVSN
jgi:hypothetical protein